MDGVAFSVFAEDHATHCHQLCVDFGQPRNKKVETKKLSLSSERVVDECSPAFADKKITINSGSISTSLDKYVDACVWVRCTSPSLSLTNKKTQPL